MDSPENSLPRFGRRYLLGMTARAALVAPELTNSLTRQLVSGILTGLTAAQPISYSPEQHEFWEQIRARIRALPPDITTYKARMMPLVDRFEVGATGPLRKLTNLYDVHQSQIDPESGRPLTDRLIQQLYMGLVTVVPGSSGPREAIIPNLRDRRIFLQSIEGFVDWVDTIEAQPDSEEWKMKHAENTNHYDLGLTTFENSYLYIESLDSDREIEIENYLNGPLSQEAVRLFDSDRQMLHQAARKYPFLQRLLYGLRIYGPGRYGQSERIEEFEKSDGKFDNLPSGGVITINMDNAPSPGETFAHEVGHLIDPISNPGLILALSAEEVFELTLKRMAALLNPAWGRPYPDSRSLYRTIKGSTDGRQLTPDEFQILSVRYPGSILVTTSYSLGMKPSNFADEVDPPLDLNMPELELPERTFPTIEEFVRENGSWIRALQGSRFRNQRIVGSVLATDAAKFNDLDWIIPFSGNFSPANRYAQGYRAMVATAIANTIYAEGFYKNDPRVVGPYSNFEIERLRIIIRKFMELAEKEYFAEAIKHTNIYEGRLAGAESNPFGQYLAHITQVLS